MAATRQHWNMEIWALLTGLPPDKAESDTSMDTSIVTDNIMTPLIMTNMDSN